MYHVLQLFLVLFLGELRVFLGDGAFRHGDDGEAAASSVPVLNLLNHLLDVIGNLRNQDNVGTAGHAGVEGQPAYFMAHDLYDEDAAVGRGCGVDVVDSVRGDVHRALEAEGHVRAPEVIVDGLGQGDDIEAFLAQEVGRLVGAVAA